MSQSNSENDKVIIVLPVSGTPYLWKSKVFNTSKEVAKELSKVVQGCFEMIDNETMRIHPMFPNRWKIADALIKDEGVEIYGNENGMKECDANMGCIRLQRDSGGRGMSAKEFFSLPLKPSRCPYFGRFAMVMSRKVLCKYIHPDCLTLVRVEDYNEQVGRKKPEEPSDEEDYEKYLGGYVYEPYDYEDDKKFCMLAKKKGWYRDSMGQVYLKPTRRPDEKKEMEPEEDSDEEEDDEEEDDEEEDDEISFVIEEDSDDEDIPLPVMKEFSHIIEEDSDDEDIPLPVMTKK